MLSRIPPLAFRLAVLLAIGLSAALLIDYARPLPAFCELGSGCERIRHSSYARWLGIPLPVFGVIGFGAMMVLSLSAKNWARRATEVLAFLGGLIGLTLLITQAFVLRFFCKLCLTVDIAAVLAALSLLFDILQRQRVTASPAPRGTTRERWLWPSATAMALLLPAGWSVLQPSPPVPPEIVRLWIPGKINVVEFADFQCPFCRKLHPAMAELLDEYAERVHFVRLNMPLPQHTDARVAARAYCCAEDQGQASAMADALFQATSLTAESCETMAASLGLSLPSYRDCMKSAATDARIDEQIARVRAAGLAGLPTVWIGSEVFVGLQPVDTLRAAFVQAARGKESLHLPSAVLWTAFAAGLLAVAAIALRSSSSRSATLR